MIKGTKKAPVVAATDVNSKNKLFTRNNCITLKQLEKQRDWYESLLIRLEPMGHEWETVASIYHRYDQQVRDYVKEF